MFFKRSAKKTTPKDDDELLGLYKASGDIAFLGTLFDRYMHLVFGVCLKYLKDEEESKDMTMQVFEKLVIAAKTNDIRNFKGWLHVLAKNECLMLLRSRKHKLTSTSAPINSDNDMEISYTLHPLEEDPLEMDLQGLELAISVLPNEQRQCIRLFYLEEKCYKTITALTGYTLNQVKSYIQNGKRNLKIQMQKIDERP